MERATEHNKGGVTPSSSRVPAGSRANGGGAGEYNPQAYWNRLVSGDMRLELVGNAGCGSAFNAWVYRRKESALREAFRREGVRLEGRSVFEAGFGVGFYTERWKSWGARRVAGVDLSAAAAKHAQRRFPGPGYDLRQGDICELEGHGERYDLVTALDVLYHVTDDERWRQGVEALAKLVADRGWLVFSDQGALARISTAPHVRRRTRADYEDVLKDLGFGRPRSYTFTRLLGHDRLPGAGWAHGIVYGIWRSSYVAVRASRFTPVQEAVGRIVGRTLFFLEQRYSAVEVNAPCLELFITRRVGTIAEER